MTFRSAVLVVLFFSSASICAQVSVTGLVRDSEGPVAFATILVTKTGTGEVCDQFGQFKMELSTGGAVAFRISAVGFATLEKEIVLEDNSRHDLVFQLEKKTTLTDVAVVSATRSERSLTTLPVHVNVLGADALADGHSLCLADGLCAAPGVRVERNCQTCGYSQVRMNGLPGRYTQILINGRPLLGSFIGLYGLDQIPTGLIERIETVRGGGSVLFGANAIAGTVNVITRSDIRPSAFAKLSSVWIPAGSQALEADVQAGASFGNGRGRGGAVFLSTNNRQSADFNADGFSELPAVLGHSMGLMGTVTIGKNALLRLTCLASDEDRNGGDALHLEPNARLQSEWRKSRIASGMAEWLWQHPDNSMGLEIFAAGQLADRAHYTGKLGSEGFGTSHLAMGQMGAVASWNPTAEKRLMNAVAGVEWMAEHARDAIPVYLYSIDQRTISSAVFAQAEWRLGSRSSLMVGWRGTDNNLVKSHIHTPRLALMHRGSKGTTRLSAASGFSAPTALDADLHMAFANGELTRVLPDPNLKPERSLSLGLGHEWKIELEQVLFKPSVSLFATRLLLPFVLENSSTGEETVFIRTNGSAAIVKGLTCELAVAVGQRWSGNFSLTLQRSRHDSPLIWSDSQPGEHSFLRTPDVYGYFALKYACSDRLSLMTSATLTGPMRVPHLAGAPGVEEDRLELSPWFWDQMFKVDWDLNLAEKAEWEINAGVANVFNAYQSDFDSGPQRDSNFIYGPGRPRSFFIGLSLSW